MLAESTAKRLPPVVLPASIARIPRCATIAAVLVCAPWGGTAQGQTLWGSLTLPGGTSAARLVSHLGVSGRPDVNFLVDLSFAAHAQLVVEDVNPVASLVAYLDYLGELRHALDGLPAGLRIGDLVSVPGTEPDPGGRALALLGLELEVGESDRSVREATDSLSLARAAWLEAIGIDRHALAERLNRDETVVVSWEDEALPLPLPDLWRQVVFEGAEARVIDMARLPKALLLYLGLVSLDQETLAWLAGRPDLFEEIYDKRSGAFAVFGRSLRVHGSTVVVPGGPADTSVWESLVGARLTEVESFIARVLGRDRGRLAYFLDTASHLDPSSRDFLLGEHLSDPSRRAERTRFLRRVYGRFANVLPTWRAHERPFFRPVVDPSLALSVVDVNPDGTLGPPWWTAVLERAATSCSWTTAMPPPRRRPAVADAGWLLTWVFDEAGAPEERLAMLRLLQRRFARQPEQEAGRIEVALCARQHMPALVLALDRMGVSTPALYADLTLASRRLTREGDAGLATLRAWQGALALVEQAVRHRELPTGTVEQLLASLVKVLPARSDDAGGAIATWVLDDLLPGVGVEGVPGVEIDPSAIEALAGPGEARDVEFDWDGLRYRLDLHGATARSAQTVLGAAMGPRLVDVRSLLEAARRLERDTPGPADMNDSFAVLRDVSASLVDATGRPLAGRLADRIQSTLRSFERTPQGAAAAARLRAEMLAMAGAVAGEVLPAMAYALAMSPVSGPPEIYAESHRFHDLGQASPAESFDAVAWAVPREVPRPEGGSRIRGAMLGLDLARASDRLRRLTTDGLVESPSITQADFTASAARLALRAREQDWEASGARVARAIHDGRQLVAEWATEAPPLPVVERVLTSAALSEWRISLASRILKAGEAGAVTGFFTMTDFYRLGTEEDLPEAWGQSGWLIESCWCLRAPDRRAPEDWLGRTAGLAASISTDLPLRLTELLASMDLPHALLEPLMPMALQDVIDHARQISTVDWEAFAWPRRLDTARVERYMLALLADGLLVAPRGGVVGDR